MFGSPDWFRPKTIGWGLTPVRWQGWAYALTWVSVHLRPVLDVLAAGASLGIARLADGHHGRPDLRRARYPPQDAPDNCTVTAEAVAGNKKDDVFYIGDSAPGPASVATRNYSFKMK